jgi:hypothetical protein
LGQLFSKRNLLRLIPGVFAFQLAVVVPITIAAGDGVAVTRGTVKAPPTPASTAQKVYIGLEPIQVANVNLGQGTWEMSFYVWWRWKGNIDPVTTTYFTNATGAATNDKVTYSFLDANGNEKPMMQKDGYWYQQAFCNVGFSDAFPLQRYPLDTQNLEVRIENTNYDYDQMYYVVDKHVSSENDLVVPGWKTKDIKYSEYFHHYGTDFGYTDRGATFQNYSLMVFDIQIERPVSHFLGKLLIPLLVVLLAAITSLFLKAGNFDTRLALTGTGLLTLIFLQEGYSSELPNPVPVVLMDKIYMLAYASVLITFFRVIWTTDRVHRKRQDEELMVKGDRRLAVTLFVSLLIGIALVVAF